MPAKSQQPDYKRAQGVPFFIIAVIFMIIAVALWLNGFDVLTATIPAAFGLFLFACGIQSFVKPNSAGRANRNAISLFTNDKLPLILGLIPLLYAVGAAFYLANAKIRIFMGFFLVFASLIFSYLRDLFRPRKAEETDRIDKFYDKVGEAEDALGIRRGIDGEDIATRRVSLKQKKGLLADMLRVAPWQLIAAIVLAQVFGVFMCFYRA